MDNSKVETLRRMGLDWAADEIEMLESTLASLGHPGGKLVENGFTVPSPREFGSRLYDAARSPLLKEIEALKADNQKLRFGIMRACLGSCTCMTKTPVQKYHHETCTYRVLMDTLYGEDNG